MDLSCLSILEPQEKKIAAFSLMSGYHKSSHKVDNSDFIFEDEISDLNVNKLPPGSYEDSDSVDFAVNNVFDVVN
jgi:hypothetical protein